MITVGIIYRVLLHFFFCSSGLQIKKYLKPQWRIQNFHMDGTKPGASLLFGIFVAENGMKMKKNWTDRARERVFLSP